MSNRHLRSEVDLIVAVRLQQPGIVLDGMKHQHRPDAHRGAEDQDPEQVVPLPPEQVLVPPRASEPPELAVHLSESGEGKPESGIGPKAGAEDE